MLALALSLTVLVAVGRAQPDQRPSGPDRERIRTVIIGKFASEMDLTPEQAEKFFPRLRQFHNQLENIQRDERDARMQIEQLSQSPDADRGQLGELLQRRKSADQQVAEMKGQFLSDISGFLTPQQVSRCSILLDELPQKVREIIREKEREKAQSGGPQRGGRAMPDRQRRRGY
jgi:Spy/CpxP family protein refolding chaperone